MNEARMSRDPILQEKAMTLQQQMMPEQLEVQMGAMKPMMFTMIFIIGIFAWLTTKVETFRVDYVSLPWAPEWHLLDGRFLFFPAWICCYICMSAAYGRALDRHIKLARYKSHPLVVAGEVLKEPCFIWWPPNQPPPPTKPRSANSVPSGANNNASATPLPPNPPLRIIRWRRTDDWNRS